MSLSENAQVFMVFASLSEGTERIIMDLPMVCEFPKVFLDDISDFPPEREVKLL